jgi:hypothetical protein
MGATCMIINQKNLSLKTFCRYYFELMWLLILATTLIHMHHSATSILNLGLLLVLFLVQIAVRKLRLPINAFALLFYGVMLMILWGGIITSNMVYDKYSHFMHKLMVECGFVMMIFIIAYNNFSWEDCVRYNQHCERSMRYIFVVIYAITMGLLLLGKLKQGFVSWGHDYNYFCLILLFGVYAWWSLVSTKRYWGIYYVFLLFITGPLIFIIGSRRGIVFFALLFIWMIVSRLVKGLQQRLVLNRQAVLILLVFVVIIAVAILCANHFSHLDNVNSSGHFANMWLRYKTLDSGTVYYQSRGWRVIYALSLYNQYDAFHMLLGHGFHFINDFAQKNNLQIADYPHNPLLSALLYSGLIGFIIAVFYYFSAFVIAYRQRKLLPFFSFITISSMFFDFLSAPTVVSTYLFSLGYVMVFVGAYKYRCRQRYLLMSKEMDQQERC